MKIKLPKELKKTVFPRVLPIEMNSFDIDLFLPSFFFRVLAEGADALTRPNKPEGLDEYVSIMARQPSLEGFADREGEQILRRLVRTSLVKMGRKGQSGKSEQISAVVPLTLLAHKSGFPKEGSRQRNVDTFLYHTLLSASERGYTGSEHLRERLRGAFGQGITFGRESELGGKYDGVTPLDTLTRLSAAFLEGLDNPKIKNNSKKRAERPACPGLAKELGTDILKYLNVYGPLMPTQALAQNLLALINFELFIYTLKVVVAISALTLFPEVFPPAMQDPFESSPPFLYVDFTDVTGGLSQNMAQACVRRDAEAFQRFLSSSLMLRDLDRYVERLGRTRKAEVDAVLDGEVSGPRYLQGLLLLLENSKLNSDIQTYAAHEEEDIVTLNSDVDADDETTELVKISLNELAQGATTDFARLVAIQADGVRTNTLGHYIGWLRGVGGLGKPYGLLAGGANGRTTWRYAPTNDLLAVLVQLAAIRSGLPDVRDNTDAIKPQTIRLQDFLTFLERRFGVIVDHPPEEEASAENAAAARKNLEAMLGRLRQMGVFDDLSDDFTAQHLRPPYNDDERQ